MENKNLNTSLDNFLGTPEEEAKKLQNNNDTQVIKQKDGLLERVDKTLVTRDGKTLLTEIWR